MASLGSMLGKMPMGPEEEDEEGMMPSSPMDEEEPAESDVPPDFQAAFDEYSEAPTAKGLYDLIELCKGGGGGKPDLALILGGKGKK